jgi:hypothetical protein
MQSSVLILYYVLFQISLNLISCFSRDVFSLQMFSLCLSYIIVYSFRFYHIEHGFIELVKQAAQVLFIIFS